MISQKVYITKTEGEWQTIDEKISKSGYEFSKYINRQISLINIQFRDCPNCVTPASGEKKQRQHYVPPHLYTTLELLSEQMKIPVSTIIDRLIIIPLLHQQG